MIVVASLDNPQFDLALLDRPPTKRATRIYSLASEAESTRIEDDRYALVLSEARASRTSSSARSFGLVAGVTLHPVPAHGVHVARGIEPNP